MPAGEDVQNDGVGRHHQHVFQAQGGAERPVGGFQRGAIRFGPRHGSKAVAQQLPSAAQRAASGVTATAVVPVVADEREHGESQRYAAPMVPSSLRSSATVTGVTVPIAS